MKNSLLFFISIFSLLPSLVTGTSTALVPTPPTLVANAYLLQDFDSGTILLEKNQGERVEPASLTKLMTAYIVFDKLRAGQLHLTDLVNISEKAWRMEGSRMYVEIGTQVPLESLLKGMIIQSGNDAAVALAEYVAGSEEAFVELMNQQARQLDLNDTHYTNSTGWPDPNQYSTAHDLALLARTIIENFPEYYRWYSEREFSYNNITQSNRNLLLWRDQTVDGMKTGFTESAGYCLVASAKRGDMRLIAVLLGSTSNKLRASEGQEMLDYGFRFFETHKLYPANQPLNTERVWQGYPDRLSLGLETPLYVTIPKGQYEQLRATLHIDRRLMAPIDKGEVIGTLKIGLGDEFISQRPLIALSAVDKGNLWKTWVDNMLLMFNNR